MTDSINHKIKPGYDYKQLLLSLTKKELQYMRKKWKFKGISHLNKEKLAEELSRRIPNYISEWLKLLTDSTYIILKEMVEKHRVGFLDLQKERDLTVFEALQRRGVVFFGRYKEDILLVMPEEIQIAIFRVLDSDQKLMTTVFQNKNLMLMCIGCLVYYGLYGIYKIYNIVSKYHKPEINFRYFLLILYEFNYIYDIFNITKENKLVLRYVKVQKWVLEEQNKRASLDFYQINKSELLYAGKDLFPAPNDEIGELKRYLKNRGIEKDEIEEGLFNFYLNINNNVPYSEASMEILTLLDFEKKDKYQELNKYLIEVYNNSPQWILKGNTPAMVRDTTVSIKRAGEVDHAKTDSQKVVNFGDFKRKQKNSSGTDNNTVEKNKKVGRNDPCPCGSGKKYKKCCLSQDENKKLLNKKLNQSGDLNDKYFSKFKYIEEFGYPLLKIDFFLLEIANICGHILDLYNKYGEINNVALQTVLQKIIKRGRNFYFDCLECEYQCPDNPFHPASLDNIRKKGVQLDSFPAELRKEKALNLFYLELVEVLLDTICFELQDRDNSQDKALEIGNVIYNGLLNFIVQNCYEGCSNRCIIDHEDNSYCNFCTFSSSRLPCPRDGEISYQEIGATVEDMLH